MSPWGFPLESIQANTRGSRPKAATTHEGLLPVFGSIQGLYWYCSVGNCAIVVFHLGCIVEMEVFRQVQSKTPF